MSAPILANETLEDYCQRVCQPGDVVGKGLAALYYQRETRRLAPAPELPAVRVPTESEIRQRFQINERPTMADQETAEERRKRLLVAEVTAPPPPHVPTREEIEADKKFHQHIQDLIAAKRRSR